ncbi:MAG: DUF2958 domain-containing protein [Bacteroidota bacterium]
MELFTTEQLEQLKKNGANRDQNHTPVVKLFTPDANATWLISEIDPDEPRLAFGLCDLGMGFPELGYVDLNEIKSVRGTLGLPVERDLNFEGLYPMTVYADAARMAEQITTSETLLLQATNLRKQKNKLQP